MLIGILFSSGYSKIISKNNTGLLEPGLLDSLLGKLPAALEVYLQRADRLDTSIKARGPAHYSEWKGATKRGEKVYAVSGECFKTATGAKTKIVECVETSAPGMLEGYF